MQATGLLGCANGELGGGRGSGGRRLQHAAAPGLWAGIVVRVACSQQARGQLHRHLHYERRILVRG